MATLIVYAALKGLRVGQLGGDPLILGLKFCKALTLSIYFRHVRIIKHPYRVDT